MKKFYFISLQTLFIAAFGQVGINVESPKATLEVAASPNDKNIIDGIIPPRLTAAELKSKDHLYTDEQRGALVYVLDDPETDFLSSIKTEKVISKGFFHYDGQQWQRLLHDVEEIINSGKAVANNVVYSAKKIGGWTLLNSGSTGWSKISLTGLVDTEIGKPAEFVEGTYTAPRDGIYMVDYEWQLSAGVDLTLLSGTKLGLLLNNNLAEEKTLNSVRVAISSLSAVTVPVTSTNLHKIVELKEGDKLSFVATSGINLRLLGDIKVGLSVHKIAD